MTGQERLAERFEEQRPRLRAMAYRMLGSVADAEDAVQESWLRLGRVDTSEIENLGGWLTTTVARICLNVLQLRKSHGKQPLESFPEPIVSRADGADPEHEALLADAVGVALFVVLEHLSPAERVAFVMHDVFAVPFEELAPIVGKTPAATRQLASRGRRKVHGTAVPKAPLDRQRAAVDAFFAAAREGNLAALVQVLDPNVVLRSNGGVLRPRATTFVSGAEAVASRAIMFSRPSATLVPALINGIAGVVIVENNEVDSIMAFTVAGDRIAEIHVFADPEVLGRVDVQRLTSWGWADARTTPGP